MMPQFDIEALRTIIVGTDLGSFARAAVHLGRSQSAVSMQLKRLEEQAGHALFHRRGRGLVPTEAGETLLNYARRIVAMHDEAALALGASAAPPTIRLGLPQDFFEEVMPSALAAFSQKRPNVHIAVRAGRNYALEEEVKAGRLDVALAFSGMDRPGTGELLATMPMFWLSKDEDIEPVRDASGGLPLVLFDHPCLFRQAALRSLDEAGIRWRLSLTTPSLPGVWAALRFGLGVTVRTAHGVPPGIRQLDNCLPALPPLELRMLKQDHLPEAAQDLANILKATVENQGVACQLLSRLTVPKHVPATKAHGSR
ncbi:LysR substrate-binding domain-containing protein [Pseudomonas aeruginosa]|uniref:LysR substrate-binding domain-containing protein n=1 Tax=Pseudomonas aeruginosa TaxID=287 RepID=UPI002904E129|nr:LysR substrate-binding domain-containing protein [Pseudomonas aeruginosa]MDU0704060.1 LysR substrate-binding domain-containing protein [Pseudomonas aeruginosa]